MGHSGDLGTVCHVEVSDNDSQVMPPRGGFRQGHCSIVVIEPADMHDEVQRATTLQHEAVHTRQISEMGTEGISNEHEITAHRETIRFLKDWKRRKPLPVEREVWCTEHGRWEKRNDRIDEVIAEEERAIATIREGTYYG